MLVNSKDGVDFAMLFTLWSSLSASTQHDGKAGGLQILLCQGIAAAYYSFTLDALALKPSDFCNVRVYSAKLFRTHHISIMALMVTKPKTTPKRPPPGMWSQKKTGEI